ncbi:cytochrome P450 [Streptomyces spongiae]|uniref:cytochrome P450 n=1 Tax=Streptomyces spongiae TaxID=565072 RepID=UPI001D15865C|nr:cytochrome P450 [Streptomyces spongiae]
MGHDLLRAADEGRIMPAECATMMIDYLALSLDTTISAISSALYLFAVHPEQWRMLKADPDHVPKAVNEVVRYESPIRAFSRTAAQDTELAGTPLPKGSRVLVLYGSANRDPLEWDDPDTFGIRRDAARQLGFGQGTQRLGRPGPGQPGDLRDPARPGRTRRPHRGDRPTRVGPEQRHPPPRAPATRTHPRLNPAARPFQDS